LLVAGVPWYWGLDGRGGGVKEDGNGGQGILINVETETADWKLHVCTYPGGKSEQ
jgi:hypothetical protein